jgi:hypothetical protein
MHLIHITTPQWSWCSATHACTAVMSQRRSPTHNCQCWTTNGLLSATYHESKLPGAVAIAVPNRGSNITELAFTPGDSVNNSCRGRQLPHVCLLSP